MNPLFPSLLSLLALNVESAYALETGGMRRVHLRGRLNAPAVPLGAETALQVATPPLANTARYDSLRSQEVDHA